MIYDVVIIGSGPAGLSAGLYAGRAALSALIIEKEQVGGQIVQTAEIENYPGCEEGESGSSLAERMRQQAAHFGVEIKSDEIKEINPSGPVKVLKGYSEEYKAKTVIIASGASPKMLGCQGEKEFTGRGVSYCATCDGAFFRDMDVYVVGGGDTAAEEALFLTRFARKVTIIHRRNELRAAKSIQEKVKQHPKIEFMWDSTVESLQGAAMLDKMTVKNVKTGARMEIAPAEDDLTFGVFVFVGFEPRTALFEGILEMESGYIRTDEDMKTNIPGVFAAGDIRVKSLRQVVTAAADGAVAAVQAEKYIEAMVSK